MNANPELDRYCQILGMNDSDLATALKVSRQTLYEWRKAGSLTDKNVKKIEALHEVQRLKVLDKIIASFPPTHQGLLAISLEILAGRLNNACKDYTAEQLSKGLLNILPDY